MALYIIGYLVFAAVVAYVLFANGRDYTYSGLFASILAGLLWPLFVLIALARKILF